MTTIGVIPASRLRDPNGIIDVDKLPQELNAMKIRDDKEFEATVDGTGTETGHVIVPTIGGLDGQPKQTISYMAERVVGQGSVGVMFQLLRFFCSNCLFCGQSAWRQAKLLLYRKSCKTRYNNRELQTVRLLDHPNVVSLKNGFFSTTDKELYLNLVLNFVPMTVSQVTRHYNKMNQRMPLIYICRA